ncbi:scyllo-inositol 2-dehydrogenase (NAD(+))-like [Amphiura filiformis]|uniref:scyllo-inositol 2-dehydrogenase (NAD(+))-like n=1 Tax=Amphiura filiformis TaxID=82378 RepID=UPI003B213F86
MATHKTDKADKQITVIVIGAGNRGTVYSNYAVDFPERLKVVGVADPRKFRRTLIQKNHNIPDDKVFEDWEDVVKQDKFADAVIIATPDRCHREPAIQCADKGYHILLEKPMDVTAAGCKAIVEAVKRNNVLLGVGHVLHYFPPAMTIKRLIDEGAIGEVINIQHLEPVGWGHFAHSFVRGNWHREDDSCFVLLAKCGHDIDLIHWWMGKHKCLKVSSFGSLAHFNKEHKPEGAASRCLDCSVESKCAYSAKQMYLDGPFGVRMGNEGWPVTAVVDNPNVETVTEALRTGPYGKCVYDTDNDVCDNQVVNFSFSEGRTATLSMVAFTEKLCTRSVKVFGTKGEIQCLNFNEVTLFDFVTRKTSKYPFISGAHGTRMTGHGGADFYIMDAFVKAVARNDPSFLCTAANTLESHLLTFAAEKSRLEGKIISMETDTL